MPRPNTDLYNFLMEIHKGQQLGFYTKRSMRFDEIFKTGIAYLQIQGVKLDPDDPLVTASLPPEVPSKS